MVYSYFNIFKEVEGKHSKNPCLLYTLFHMEMSAEVKKKVLDACL